MDDFAPPVLVFVVGPLAVGKMSVGQAIVDRTGLQWSHVRPHDMIVTKKCLAFWLL